MSTSNIICATTESTSKKSKRTNIKGIKTLFRRFEFLAGPAHHHERTPAKHTMALSQAIIAKKTQTHVFLIFLLPENSNYPHLDVLIKKAEENKIDVTIINPADFQWLVKVKHYSDQRQKWDKGPDTL